MKKYLGTFFVVLISMLSFGQVVNVYQSRHFEQQCLFNATFLKNNNIRRITGKISVKKDMQPITSKGLIEQYSFNQQGLITEHLSTMKLRGGRIDTTQNAFSYDNGNQLVQKTTHYVKAYDAVRFQYDAAGKIKEEIVVRGANESEYKFGLNKGTETVVKSERFEWKQINDSTEMKVFYNAADKAYKELVVVYNRIGQLKSENTTFYLTKKRNVITYKYSDIGQLVKVIDYSNISGQQTVSYTFDYDEYGNLIAGKVFKNGKLTTSNEYLYDPKTLFLSAQLSKNESSRSIKIIQYEYERF